VITLIAPHRSSQLPLEPLHLRLQQRHLAAKLLQIPRDLFARITHPGTANARLSSPARRKKRSADASGS
jgi:hypothetical protein